MFTCSGHANSSGVLVLAITSHHCIQNSFPIPDEQNFSRTEKAWEMKNSDGLSEMQQEGKAGETLNPLPGSAFRPVQLQELRFLLTSWALCNFTDYFTQVLGISY